MRVFAILIDRGANRVGLNIKNVTLPERVRQYEGKIALFGGKVEDGESLREALARELAEEVPGFLTHDAVGNAREILADRGVAVFAVDTDLSGTRHNRKTSRIGQLARCCQEGDGVVRSKGFVEDAGENLFVDPLIKRVILQAFDQ